jgi:TolB-like protein/Tfp pilus assembly protein PilF
MANLMSPRGFFGELKRRNVYKVAVAYAVASWLLIQIATQVFPFFEIPNWAVRLVVLVLIAGFPVALVFSWAFEITPEGIKRESEIEDGKSITHHAGKKIVAITVVLAVIAAGLLVFQLVRPKSTAAPRQSKAGIAVPEKSVAVLPFDNLSDDKSNAYFTEGIQDEILTRLSKIAALKVISRTSTQKYKSAPDNLREIGNQLGVANLLEGSVQKIANAVHINVQLIRAATDEHLWAESYNRKLDDVFGVEGEVATAIADQLNAKLTGAEQKAVADKPTQNLAAYDAYLRALSIEHQRYGYDPYQQAAAEYARAVQLDPNFALAWARLGVIRSFLFFNGVDTNTNSAAAVKEAADKAMALQPDLAEAWIAQGAYRYRVLRDFPGALQAYDEGRKRLPNLSLVYQYMAYVERRLNRWKDAEEHYKKAAELDPQNFQVFVSMGGELLNYLRRFKEAHAALDRALVFSPGAEGALANKANLFQSEGRLQEAAATLARVPPDSTDDLVVLIRATQASFERHFDDAIAILQRKLAMGKPGEPLSTSSKADLMQLGYCYEWAGRPDEARAAFVRALQAFKPSPDAIIAPDALGLPEFVALTYAGLGEKEKALAQAKQAVADYANDAVNKPAAETVLAQIQARFGDFDSAIAAIPHLLEVPAGITPADLRLNPVWDPLRKDPRFQKLANTPP